MNKGLTIALIVAVIVIISLVVYYKMFPKVVTVTKTVNTWKGHNLNAPPVNLVSTPETVDLSTERVISTSDEVVRIGSIVKKK